MILTWSYGFKKYIIDPIIIGGYLTLRHEYNLWKDLFNRSKPLENHNYINPFTTEEFTQKMYKFLLEQGMCMEHAQFLANEFSSSIKEMGKI
jgi:hypothetical protein